MPRSRVVAIGFHGGGRYYTEPLLKAGRLPVLARLAAEGLTLDAASTWPVAAASWVTLLTGLDVAQHGVVDVCEFDARCFPSMSARPVQATVYADQTLFSIASAHGRSVAGLGIPMTFPAWPVAGVLVPSFPAPNERFPPTWPRDLLSRFGPVSLGQADDVDVRDREACRRFLDFDLDRMGAMGRTIYAERDWDFFFLVFKVPDLANHLFCQNPHVPGWRALIDEYLIRTDTAVGQFLGGIDPASTVIVISDHGSGPQPPLLFRVMTWLEREGLLSRRHQGLVGGSGLARLQRAYRAVRGSPLAKRVRKRLPATIVDRVRALGHHWPFVDLSRTRVYPVDMFYPLAGFQVNVVGREAHGIVPRSAQEREIDDLFVQLSAITLPGTDTPLCRRLFRREELFTGPHADRLPDVVAELDPSVEANLHFAPDLFDANTGKTALPHHGYHTPDALFLMRGPGVPAGQTMAGAHVRDFMPTVLRLLDVPIPSDRRGRALPA